MKKDYAEKIVYSKAPLSIKTQISKLKKRGLIIDDEENAADYLFNISYYRLRAYTYPFQENTDPDADHKFIRSDVKFKDIIDLYCFDRRLRSLLFNAIEKIEVALRAKITQIYSESTNDSHWHENEALFRDTTIIKKGESLFLYDLLWEDIVQEVSRSNEEFIKHYKTKYSQPETPPAWMTLEVISLGTLSRLYQLLVKDEKKTAVAKSLGLKKVDLMENWLHALSTLRNHCAHHSRIWNRRFVVNIALPNDTANLFLDRAMIKTIRTNKLFAYLCCIKYILDLISPKNDFLQNLKIIMADAGSLLSLKEMGFPINWMQLWFWKE